MLQIGKVFGIRIWKYLGRHHIIDGCRRYIGTFQGIVDIAPKHRQILRKPETKCLFTYMKLYINIQWLRPCEKTGRN